MQEYVYSLGDKPWNNADYSTKLFKEIMAADGVKSS